MQHVTHLGVGLGGHERGERRHALGLGDAAGGDHLVEGGLALVERARSDGRQLHLRIERDQAAEAAGEPGAQLGVAALVVRRPAHHRRNGRARVEAGDHPRQPLEPQRRLLLHPRAEGQASAAARRAEVTSP